MSYEKVIRVSVFVLTISFAAFFSYKIGRLHERLEQVDARTAAALNSYKASTQK